jgi:alpha-tubulin suppressor-like RCC1 family protein
LRLHLPPTSCRRLSFGKKIYFFVDGDQTGVGQVLQTFHSKAIVDLRQGGARKNFLARDFLPAKAPAKPRQIISQLVKGVAHACALHEGRVLCWGSNDYGQTNVPPLKNPVQILSGASFSCAMDDSGIQCWGSDQQVLPLPKLEKPTQIAAGGHFMCAIDNGIVKCWGNNDNDETQVPQLKESHPSGRI